MVVVPMQHIAVDDRGIAYIAGTSIRVADVAIDAYTWAQTPDEIRDNYPHLSLAQIHAALAYYHDHRKEIDRQLAEWNREYQELRSKSPNPLTRSDFEQRRSNVTAKKG